MYNKLSGISREISWDYHITGTCMAVRIRFVAMGAQIQLLKTDLRFSQVVTLQNEKDCPTYSQDEVHKLEIKINEM